MLQQPHNLCDDRIEYPIRDRLSFLRFLGLPLEDRGPDANTVGLFREQIKARGLMEICLPASTSSGPHRAFEVLLDQSEEESGHKRAIYADSAYRSVEKQAMRDAMKSESHIGEKGSKSPPLSE